MNECARAYFIYISNAIELISEIDIMSGDENLLFVESDSWCTSDINGSARGTFSWKIKGFKEFHPTYSLQGTKSSVFPIRGDCDSRWMLIDLANKVCRLCGDTFDTWASYDLHARHHWGAHKRGTYDTFYSTLVVVLANSNPVFCFEFPLKPQDPRFWMDRVWDAAHGGHFICSENYV